MELRLPHVLDTSVALIAEGYQSLGMDWWTALETAQEAGSTKVPETASGQTVTPKREKTEAQKVAENNAVLASLMGGLKDTTFGGARA